MTDVNFVRDGKVGDKVHDPRFGNGTIEKLDESYSKPVCVRYKYDYVEQYDANGLWGGAHLRPILCWGHRAPLDQGQPPERFDYPLYRKSNDSELVVEFTGLREGKVLVVSETFGAVGATLKHWTEHTDTRRWTPCDKPVWKPVWKPTKPTWCLVSDQDTAWIEKPMLVLGYIEDYSHPYFTSSGDAFLHAKPCRKKDLPKWRPKDWE